MLGAQLLSKTGDDDDHVKRLTESLELLLQQFVADTSLAYFVSFLPASLYATTVNQQLTYFTKRTSVRHPHRSVKFSNSTTQIPIIDRTSADLLIWPAPSTLTMLQLHTRCASASTPKARPPRRAVWKISANGNPTKLLPVTTISANAEFANNRIRPAAITEGTGSASTHHHSRQTASKCPSVNHRTPLLRRSTRRPPPCQRRRGVVV